MRNKIWILLLFLLNNSLLFSQHCHIGDVITNPDGSKGVVFYLNPDRMGGWMVALNDQSPGCQWGTKQDIPRLPNYDAQTTDPLLLEMDGKENTRIIRAFQNDSPNYAAGKVDFENGWYLPSIGQLRILFSKLALINSSLIANGGSVLGNGKYWSSTEHDASNAKALSGDQGGGFHVMVIKNGNASVRAIRDFSFLEWSTGLVADSLKVYPSEDTTYSVTLIEGTTCPNFDYTASIEIVVSPVPEDVTINPAGPLQICESDELHLQAQTSNNKNWTYLWRDLTTQQIFPETNAELIVNDLSIGQHQIQVIVSSATNGNCSDSTMVEVEVFPPIEAMLSGTSLVCVNTQFDLSATPTGDGLTYIWKRNGVEVPEWTDASEVHPEESIAGSYEYTVTISDGICTDESEPFTVVIEEIVPTLTGPAWMCVDTQFDLVAAPTGEGLTYIWKRNGVEVPEWTGPQAHPSEATVGQYVYTVTVSDGICTAESEPLTVEVEDLTANASGPVRVCVGSEFILEASPAINTYSYIWKRNGVVISETGSSLFMTENNVGTYDYTVTISDGICTDESEPLTITVEDLTATLTGPQVACVGIEFNLVAGPTEGYTYSWKRNGVATSWTTATVPVTESVAGQYDYSVTIANSICTDNANWTVNVEETVASIEGPNAVCPGDAVTLTANPEGMSYLWSTGETGRTITVTPTAQTTQYSVTVTSSNGCHDDATHTVTLYPSVTASIDGDASVCPGDAVTLTANPAGMTYLWSTGETGRTITVTPTAQTTDYSVTVTSSNSCHDDATHTVTLYPSVTASIDGDASVCPGDAVTLTANPAGMTYLWSTGETGRSITVTPTAQTTDYTVTVTSSDGCHDETTHTVTLYPSVTASIDGDASVCPGGSVTLTANPAGMSYLWSTGETGRTITVTPTVPTTDYSVTVTSSDGCQGIATHMITLSASVNSWIDGPTSVCPGNTVSLSAKPDGMASYVWSTGETTQTITVLAGTYSVTVTSADGCEGTASLTINEFPSVTATIEGETSVCEGSTITLIAKPDGMSYLWSNGMTDQTITVTPDAPSTTYSVTVISADGCSDEASHMVTVRPLPIADASGSDTNVDYNTSAILRAADAGSGAVYHWTPEDLISIGQGTATATTIPLTLTTTFYLSVEVDGCQSTVSDQVTVTVGDALYATVSVDPTSVCEGGTTTLTAIASNGTGNYNYSWTPTELIESGQGTSQVVSKPLEMPMTFTCTVDDGNETISPEVTVMVFPSVTATIEGETSVCEGSTITLIAKPDGMSYLWSNGMTDQTITVTPDAPSTTYSVTVTSADGCSNDATHMVTVKPLPIADASGSDTNVDYGASATLRAADAGSGAVYHWSPEELIATGQGTATATTGPLTDPTTFYLTVTLDGCESPAPDEVTVTVGDALYASATADPTSVCPGGNTTLTVTATGGMGDYTYDWQPQEYISGNNTNQTVTTTALDAAQQFICTVTDEVGATWPASVTVTLKPQPTTEAGADQNVPYGGVATLEAAEAGTGAEYHWSPADKIDGDPNQRAVTTLPLTDPLNTFQLTVTLDGCESAAPDEVTVTVGDALFATAIADPDLICPGSITTLSVTATGGTVSYTYNWQPQDYIAGDNTTQTVTTIALDAEQTFEVTVTDAVGATYTANVTITMKPLPTTDAGADQNVSYGGTATLEATDAGTGAEYHWSPADKIDGDPNQRIVTTLPLTDPLNTFQLTVTLDGCESAAPDEVTVTVGDALFASATADPSSICPGSITTLSVTVTGGSGDYTYDWQPQVFIDGDNTTQTVTTTVLDADQPFTCTVTDEEGVTFTAPVTVTMKPVPIADASGSDHYSASGTTVTLVAADAGEGAQYYWEPEDLIDTGLDAMVATTQPLVGPGPYQFYLTVTSADGCTNYDTVTVIIGDELDVVVTTDPVCRDEAAVLKAEAIGGTGQYNYHWEPSEYIAYGQNESQATTIGLTEDKTFDVTVSDGYASIKASVAVTVETPVFDTIPQQTACLYYVWFDNDTLTQAGYHDHVVPGLVCDTTFVLYLEIVDEYNDTIPKTACDFYDWNENTYFTSGCYTDTLVSEQGCDSIVTLKLDIINPDLQILGYKDIFVASDVWHGIYHYYVVDSISIPLAPIQWQCDNPDWIVLQMSDYHCKLIATTEGSSWLTAHTLVADNCDEEMSILINATPYYDDADTPVALFPNPARSEVTVQAEGMTRVRMIDLMGQVLRDVEVKISNSIDIDTGNMKRGVYLVEITTVNEVIIKRLVLAKH